MLVSPSALVVEQIGDNYHEEPILGFSIVNETGLYYIPKEIAIQSQAFKSWAEDESMKKWVFDSKRSVVALRWQGIELKGTEFDALLAAYIINPGNSYDDVASVAKEYGLNIVSKDEAVYGKGAKRAVPAEKSLPIISRGKRLPLTASVTNCCTRWKKIISLNYMKISNSRLRLFSEKWNQWASKWMLKD